MNETMRFGAGVEMLAIRAMVQAAAILAVAWAISKWAKPKPAALRHAVWLSALVAILVCPVISSLIDKAETTGIRFAQIVALLPDAKSAFETTNVMPVTESIRRAKYDRPELAGRVDGDVAGFEPASAVPVVTRPDSQRTNRILAIDNRTILRVFLVVWAFGASMLLCVLGFGLVSLHRLRARAITCKDPAILETLARACESVGWKSRPEIAITNELKSPVAFGIFRPVIMLPRDLVESSCASRLRQILVHEAAHLARRDPLVGLLQQAAVALYWPNPLVHVMSRGLSRTREEICDNFVLLEGGRASYARLLIELSESFQKSRGPIAAELLPRRWNIADRVTGLIDIERNLEVRTKPTHLFALGLISVSIGLPFAAISNATEQNTGSKPAAAKVVEADPAENPKPNSIAQNEIGGIVVDKDGKPIAGATVDVYSWAPGNVARTGPDGAFRVNVEVYGRVEAEVQMRVTKPGYCPKSFWAVKTGSSDTKAVLDDTTWIEGIVRDPAGNPVAEATVRAETPMMRDGRPVGSYWTETKSGADGRYTLHVEPAAMRIFVNQPGVGVFRSETVTLASGESTKVDANLRRSGTLRAKVVDSVSGEPVQGFRLKKWLHNNVFEHEGESDKDGILTIEDIPSSVVNFQTEASGYARWWSEQAKSEWTRKSISREDPFLGNWQRNFDGLDFEINEGTKDVVIVVEKDVTIRGTVLDPDGKPVAGATVAPALTGTGNSLTGDTRFSVKSDEQGKFEMKLPASGERVYNLIVHDGGYFEWRNWANGVSKTIVTKPGEVLEDFDMTLSRPAGVRGRVLDPNGDPVANREVRASAEDTLENRYYDPTTKTDSEGRFELKFIRPGTQYIQVHPFWLEAKFAPEGTSQTLTLKADETVEGLEFKLPKP